MPNRIVREGIVTSERVDALGWAEEVFYRRLMSVVDDFGRFHANPKLIRAACYPLRLDKVSDADIGKWLTACVNAALVSVYPAEDGKRYLELLDFRQHARAKESKFPAPDEQVPADALHVQCARDASAPVFVCGDVDEDGGDKKARKRATPPECPPDVEPQVWADWCALRKSKRATVSETVVAGAREEATKAGMSLSDFLRVWCVRGSQGLQAEWLKPHERQQAAQSFRERDAELAKAEAAKWMGSYARQNVIDQEDITDARTPRLAAS